MTIKNRLAVNYTLLTGAILLIFSAAVYFIVKSYLVADFNERIKQRMQFTAELLIKNGMPDISVTNSLGNEKLNTLLNEQIIIISENDSVWLNTFKGSHYSFDKKFIDSVNNDDLKVAYRDTSVWCGTVITSGSSKLKLLTEIPVDFIGGLQKFKFVLIVGTLLVLLILFFSGRIFAANALKPIAKAIKQVDEITHSNLHKRLDVGTDDDELSKMSRTFNQLLERLETAFELQRNFVSNASHELRTPLSAITAQLEVTLMHNRGNDEYKIILQSVLDDIRDLNQLSEGLFDLTLASRDVSLMKFGDVRVDELLMQARSELLKRKPEYVIHLHIGELPDDEIQLTVYGKEHLLKSTFRNLMDNACKFSENKTVDVFLDIHDEKISIRFIDKGIGMPDSYLKNIYTPLLRADNAKRIPGHGLGLALAKKIVELHQGKITVESKEKSGTTVSLQFFSQKKF